MKANLALLLTLFTSLLLFFQHKQIDSQDQFQQWKFTFAVQYSSPSEEKYRQIIFQNNLIKINQHNADKKNTYLMGVNQFTALTQQQFAQLYLNQIHVDVNKQSDDLELTQLQADIDWIAKGAVTPVKDQGKCAAPWAFAATSAIEGLSKIGYGVLQDFSQQQLIDCSGQYGNLGCNGGLVDYSFAYIKAKGISKASQYPYAGTKQTCLKDGGSFKVSGFVDITNCNTLTSALNDRPISVAVDAFHWHAYQNGIFNNCGTRLNHEGLLVGATNDYWKIKNSWGTSWGESGYIRLAKGNTCGLCNKASYPLK